MFSKALISEYSNLTVIIFPTITSRQIDIVNRCTIGKSPYIRVFTLHDQYVLLGLIFNLSIPYKPHFYFLQQTQGLKPNCSKSDSSNLNSLLYFEL